MVKRTVLFIVALAGLVVAGVSSAGCGRDGDSASAAGVESAAPASSAEGQLRLMPLGDSITEGWNRATTYRSWLGAGVAKSGARVDFVGTLNGTRQDEPPSPDFDADHEGHWGWTTGQVLAEIDGWAKAAKPDVVLMHLGTNDVGGSPDKIARNLSEIIDRLRAANPRVTILVARLIPIARVPAEKMAAVNDGIQRMAEGKNEPGSRVVVVRQDDGFDARGDTTDGVHPNESGARKMAARWLDALRPFLGRTQP